MFLKHNILFYNLDQNVFTVDMKTYFYKILKMISIYVLEMIFYTIILGNTVITVHTALVELLVSTRIIFPEICHTHKSRHTGMCILIWLDFLYWLLIIFFEALYLVLLHVHVLKSAWWSWPSKGIKYRACVI